MGFENSGAIRNHNETVIPQEELARQYLEAYAISQQSNEEWQLINNSKDIDQAESGHNLDAEPVSDDKREKMNELSREIERQQAIMNSIFEKLTDETKDAYLRAPNSN